MSVGQQDSISFDGLPESVGTGFRPCGQGHAVLSFIFLFLFFFFLGGERSRVLPEKILQVSRARGGDITTESYSRVYLILLTNDIDRNTKDRVDGYGFR